VHPEVSEVLGRARSLIIETKATGTILYFFDKQRHSIRKIDDLAADLARQPLAGDLIRHGDHLTTAEPVEHEGRSMRVARPRGRKVRPVSDQQQQQREVSRPIDDQVEQVARGLAIGWSARRWCSPAEITPRRCPTSIAQLNCIGPTSTASSHSGFALTSALPLNALGHWRFGTVATPIRREERPIRESCMPDNRSIATLSLTP